MSSLAVVGGGITGLATAFYLRKLCHGGRIVLYEGSNRCGGWIKTTRLDDGVIFEQGPRTIRPNGPAGANTLLMAQELGLSNEIMYVNKHSSSAQVRCIYADDQLHQLPNSFISLLHTQKPFSHPLIYAGINDLMTAPEKCTDDSLYNFVKRRFGVEVADYAVDPMVRGICAGDAREISASSFIGAPLFEMEQQYGSVLKGALRMAFSGNKSKTDETCDLMERAKSEKWRMWSLENGLSQLTEKLKMVLDINGVEIREKCPVRQVKAEDDYVTVSTDQGEKLYHHVFMATPSHVSSKLLRDADPEISAVLNTIPFVTVAVVNLEFDQNVIPFPAFGFLVPSSESHIPILGCIYDTCSFDQGERAILTVMLGGHEFNRRFAGRSKDYIQETAVKAVQHCLKFSVQPTRSLVNIHRDCIAQYTLGHKHRVALIRKKAEMLNFPVSFCGASYDGVGINDAIMSAKNQVDRYKESAVV